MANTLTNLIPDIYAALNVVSREMVGFIPAVTRDSGVERAAVNQTVRVPVVPAIAAANNTPGTLAPDTGDATLTSETITISKSRHAPIRINGEETKGLANAGTGTSIMQQRFEQAFRTLVNEIEDDLASLYVRSSRAYGTAGTTPFGTAADLTDLSSVLQILEDNGCPSSDLQLVLSSAAWANLRGKQSTLFKVNEAGSSAMLRTGMLDTTLEGFALRNSSKVKAHTKGTGASYLVNNGAGYAVGDTAVTLDTGSGTILAGDVVTFAGDSNKYVNATALAANVTTLAAPGLRATLADNVALTVGNSYRANMAFRRSAMVLATRFPAMPEGGDMADDVYPITDPYSGLSFEIAVYRQYLQVHYQVRIAWGYANVKPEHTAILLG